MPPDHDVVRGRVVLHLLAGLELIMTRGLFGRLANAVPAAKTRQGRVRQRDTARRQLLMHTHQVAPALHVEGADGLFVRLGLFGPFDRRHLGTARNEHAAHGVARNR
jgi:hypothetical protein